MSANRPRPALVLSFGALIVLGLSGGATGVLIPNQQSDYHVDKSTIGLLFFAFSAGYLLSGVATGLLVRKLGARGQLAMGALVLAVGSAGSALRPPFAVLAVLSMVLAFGTGVLDAGYNAYVAHLPEPTGLLNLLHAGYGVGALIGPLLAAFLLNAGFSWRAFYLVLTGLGVVLAVGAGVLLPGPAPVVAGAPTASVSRALRRPEVWLGIAFLFGYLGLEITIGSWGFSFLTQYRGQGELLAGWVVSGYWLGLTLGRFLVSAIASRLRISPATMMYAMVIGVCVCSLLLWVIPGGVATSVLLLLIGVFLGPIFPTVIAVLPQLTPAALVPTAIGLIMGISIIGGSLLPWAAGALAQHQGLATFPPFLLVVGALCVLGWWSIARRIPAGTPAEPVAGPVAEAAELAAAAGKPLPE
jgi:fucose permease